MHFPSKLHSNHTWHMIHVLRWKQLSEFSKTLRTYCFHWNSWLLSQQQVSEVGEGINTPFRKKTKRWVTFSYWDAASQCAFGPASEGRTSSASPWHCQGMWFCYFISVLGLSVWFLSSLHAPWVPIDVCSGCGSCSYLWRGLLFLSMTNTIFPAIFWNSCFCTALPCCCPLCLESDRDFWICAELD